MVQRLHDIITFIFIVSIGLFILAGLVCFCHVVPLIYEGIRNRSKVKPICKESEKEKIIMNPLQVEIVEII
jgi:hypothetical protein